MSHSVEILREIIERLRAPDGCPWDREQTAETLCSSLIEEAYEVVDAIERGHLRDLEEELGDLLINIMLQAQIASEQNLFTFHSIAAAAAGKLVRRHPHVFVAAKAKTSEDVLKQWDEIKRDERSARVAQEGGGNEEEPESIIDGVARSFPALVRAQKMQKKAARAGFDWKCPEEVLEKVREEIVETEAEMRGTVHEFEEDRRDSRERQKRLAEELGDLLFAVVNLSRALSIDAESALQTATNKFARRFRSMEQEARNTCSGRSFSGLTFDEKNTLWNQVKEREKRSPGTTLPES
jgi:MazG family protein